MTRRYGEQVAAGAALLDEHMPGWEKRVNLKTLDLASCERCVVGQLGGPEAEDKGIRALGLDSVVNGYWPSQLGFSTASWDDDERGMAEYAALTREWMRVIRARLAGGKAP